MHIDHREPVGLQPDACLKSDVNLALVYNPPNDPLLETAPVLAEGIGCIIGTRLFMREQLAAGTLHARPIVNPTLARSLQFCRLVDHPATFVLEAMRDLLLELIRAEIDAGRWQARPLF